MEHPTILVDSSLKNLRATLRRMSAAIDGIVHVLDMVSASGASEESVKLIMSSCNAYNTTYTDLLQELPMFCVGPDSTLIGMCTELANWLSSVNLTHAAPNVKDDNSMYRIFIDTRNLLQLISQTNTILE